MRNMSTRSQSMLSSSLLLLLLMLLLLLLLLSCVLVTSSSSSSLISSCYDPLCSLQIGYSYAESSHQDIDLFLPWKLSQFNPLMHTNSNNNNYNNDRYINDNDNDKVGKVGNERKERKYEICIIINNDLETMTCQFDEHQRVVVASTLFVSSSLASSMKSSLVSSSSSLVTRRHLVTFVYQAISDVGNNRINRGQNPHNWLYNETFVYYIKPLPARPLVPGRLHIETPVFGSIVEEVLDLQYQKDPKISQLYSFASQLYIHEVTKQEVVLNSTITSMNAANIEPASWFLEIKPIVKMINPKYEGLKRVANDGEVFDDEIVEVFGYPEVNYLEFVLSPNDIQGQRMYSQQWELSNLMGLVYHGGEASSNTDIIRATTTPEMLETYCLNDMYISRLCSQRSKVDKRLNQMDKNPKINVCIWGSNKLDGQKSIWLQQVKHLPKDRFSFMWVLTSDTHNMKPGTVANRLFQIANSEGYELIVERVMNSNMSYNVGRAHRIRLGITPFDGFGILYEELLQRPDDGSPSAEAMLAVNGKKPEDYIYEYASSRLRVANYQVERVSPPWVAHLYRLMVEAMKYAACSVAVYGNDRGFNSDVLIRDSAYVLGIPTVVELLNLFMDPAMTPDVVVSPSLSAYQHESIAAVRTAAARTAFMGAKYHPVTGKLARIPRVVIIPPSVDVDRFHAPSIGAPVHRHPECNAFDRRFGVDAMPVRSCDDPKRCSGSDLIQESSCSISKWIRQESHEACIHIGFVARLATEKNVGLFLLAAHKILQSYPLARFTIVGDGVIRGELQQLVEMLDIAWAVDFIGWVDNLLPRVLKSFDMIINPSIRGWSETFCIANIEAMSMEIPLITFAVGGIGEYVATPTVDAPTPAMDQLKAHNDVSNNEYNLSSHASRRRKRSSLLAQRSNSKYANIPPFSIASNALVVNVATPVAIFKAVDYLLQNCTARESISKAGRQTVLAYFTAERQMDQYSELYEELVA